MNKPPDLMKREAAAMGKHDLQVRQFVERAGEHRVRQHHGCVEEIADEIDDVFGRQQTGRGFVEQVQLRARHERHHQFELALLAIGDKAFNINQDISTDKVFTKAFLPRGKSTM